MAKTIPDAEGLAIAKFSESGLNSEDAQIWDSVKIWPGENK